MDDFHEFLAERFTENWNRVKVTGNMVHADRKSEPSDRATTPLKMDKGTCAGQQELYFLPKTIKKYLLSGLAISSMVPSPGFRLE